MILLSANYSGRYTYNLFLNHVIVKQTFRVQFLQVYTGHAYISLTPLENPFGPRGTSAKLIKMLSSRTFMVSENCPRSTTGEEMAALDT